MAPDTFAAAYRQLARTVPFTPFAVELVTREVLIVSHPEVIGGEGGVLTYLDHEAKDFVLFDAWCVLRLKATFGAVDPGDVTRNGPTDFPL